MKNYFRNIIYFLLPIIFVALLLEILLRWIPNDYSVKNEYLNNHCNEIETLILGSSHSLYGLDPIYFTSNTFNASYASQTLEYDLEILKKFENKMSNLKTVIVNISYGSFYYKIIDSKEPSLIKNYVLNYNIKNSYSPKFYTEILSLKLSRNFKRINSYYLKGETKVTMSELGWGTLYNSKNSLNLEETGRVNANRHTQKELPNLKFNLSKLKSLIEICDKKNVNVVLFTAPTYKTYRNNLNKYQLLSTLAEVNNIANDYNNCTYINLLDDANFKYIDFYDGDHLNERGAKKISNLLNTYIEDKERY